jgi:hypothetical protein
VSKSRQGRPTDEQEPPPPRTATFAGFLGQGDYALNATSDRAIINRPARGPAPYLDATHRTVRPYLSLGVPWSPQYDGADPVDVAETEAPALAAKADIAGFCPGTALEAWLLPVRNENFEFLVTPAEWDA